MELAAAVDHRMHRHQRRALAAEMALDLGEHAHRQRRGDHRHDDQIGSAHHLLAGLGEPGRAIEQHPLIGIRQCAEQLGETLLLVELVEGPIERAQRGICGDQVEPVDPGVSREPGGLDIAREDAKRDG